MDLTKEPQPNRSITSKCEQKQHEKLKEREKTKWIHKQPIWKYANEMSHPIATHRLEKFFSAALFWVHVFEKRVSILSQWVSVCIAYENPVMSHSFFSSTAACLKNQFCSFNMRLSHKNETCHVKLKVNECFANHTSGYTQHIYMYRMYWNWDRWFDVARV